MQQTFRNIYERNLIIKNIHHFQDTSLFLQVFNSKIKGLTFFPLSCQSLMHYSAYEQKFFSLWSNRAYALVYASSSLLNSSSTYLYLTSLYLFKNEARSSCLSLASSFSCCSAMESSSFLIFQNSVNSCSSYLPYCFSTYLLLIYCCLDFSIASFIWYFLLSYSSNSFIAFSSASFTCLLRISSSLFLIVLRCSHCLSTNLYLVVCFSQNF